MIAFSKCRPRACAAGTVLILSLAAIPSAVAQGNGKGKGKASPPSRNELPAPDMVGAVGAAPISWIDDANLLPPNTMALSLSVMHWRGTGITETDLPIGDVAVGMTKRLQFTASVPRILGSSEAGGPVGGLGTTYFSGKYAVFTNRRRDVKVAVSPSVQVMSTDVAQSLVPGESRFRWGVPVSMELDRSDRRYYGSTGYFAGGAWFVGGGAGMWLSQRTGVSASFSRAWSTTGLADPSIPRRSRNEISGGTSYAPTPHVSVFGSISRTFRTSDANGHGTTFSGGISLLVSGLKGAP